MYTNKFSGLISFLSESNFCLSLIENDNMITIETQFSIRTIIANGKVVTI